MERGSKEDDARGSAADAHVADLISESAGTRLVGHNEDDSNGQQLRDPPQRYDRSGGRQRSRAKFTQLVRGRGGNVIHVALHVRISSFLHDEKCTQSSATRSNE